MVENFNHQKTIGVVGANPEALAYVLEAKRLGFDVIQLFKTEDEKEFWFGADKKLVGNFDDAFIQEEFLMQSDLLVYFDYSLASGQIEEARKSAFVPQKDDVLSIARDRVLQNAFKESLSINIAPYETIVSRENIKESLRRVGYPAVLRTNFIDSNEARSYFIYEENDIQNASELLKYGTCVLESWITAENEYSLTLVKTASGEIRTFPIVKNRYRNDRLSMILVNVEIEPELQEEIERVSIRIAENIEFQGVMTVKFVVSPANALYTSDIYPFPNLYSRYTVNNQMISANEAHLRAVTELPMPEIAKEIKPYLFVPLYGFQQELIDDFIALYPNWKLNLYPTNKKETIGENQIIGHLTIETTDMNKTINLLKEYRI